VSRERIAAAQSARRIPYFDHQIQADRLNDLWVEWVKLILELELEAVVRRQFAEVPNGVDAQNVDNRAARCLGALRLRCGTGSEALAFLRSAFWSRPPKLFLLDTAGSSRQTASRRMHGHLVDSFCCIFTGSLSLKLKRCYGRVNSAARGAG
jgi:hypothetical protein